MREAAKSAQLGARVSRRGFPPKKATTPVKPEGRASVKTGGDGDQYYAHLQESRDRTDSTKSTSIAPPAVDKKRAVNAEDEGRHPVNNHSAYTQDELHELSEYGLNARAEIKDSAKYQKAVRNRRDDARIRYLMGKAGPDVSD